MEARVITRPFSIVVLTVVLTIGGADSRIVRRAAISGSTLLPSEDQERLAFEPSRVKSEMCNTSSSRQAWKTLNQADIRCNYCLMESCKKGPHVLCKYPLGPSSACGTVQSATITPAEIKEVLNKHNELRAKVAQGHELRGRPGPQPAAKNIPPLKWNYELARLAQTWANQCKPKHDDCRNTRQFNWVGQNVAFEGWSDRYRTPLSELVIVWYNEVEDFDPRDVEDYRERSPKTGHYTQMVWATSTELGCGVIRFNHNVTSKGRYQTRLVCNYGPGGNVLKMQIYEKSTTKVQVHTKVQQAQLSATTAKIATEGGYFLSSSTTKSTTTGSDVVESRKITWTPHWFSILAHKRKQFWSVIGDVIIPLVNKKLAKS